MKSRTCTARWKLPAASILLLVLSLWPGWFAAAASGVNDHPTSATATLTAGAAAAPLALPKGTLLAGYGRDRALTGTLDPLYAKAIFLADEQRALAIVTVDNIGLTRPDVQRAQRRSAELLASEGIHLAPEHVIISSTHTHAGPDVVGLWGSHFLASGRDPVLLAAWVEAIGQQVLAAARNREPVVVQDASAAAPLHWVENRSEPDSIDSTLSTLALISQRTGLALASLTNYACHPTVLGPDNTLGSADWVSGFYQAMDAALPGVHLFLQGAIGGWVQPIQNQRTIVEARSYGNLLAQRTVSLLHSAPITTAATLDIATATVHFELDNFGFEVLMWLGVMDRPTSSAGVPADFAWFRIGRSLFATHPGETAPTYSMATRELLRASRPQAPTFVLGLTQDALGYILRPEFFADDAPFADAQYLTSVSLGVHTGPTLMRALQTLIESQPSRTTP